MTTPERTAEQERETATERAYRTSSWVYAAVEHRRHHQTPISPDLVIDTLLAQLADAYSRMQQAAESRIFSVPVRTAEQERADVVAWLLSEHDRNIARAKTERSDMARILAEEHALCCVVLADEIANGAHLGAGSER